MTRYAQTLRSTRPDLAGSSSTPRSAMERISFAVRSKPEALLLLAAGCALMVGAGRSMAASVGRQASHSDPWTSAGAASSAGERASSAASQAAGYAAAASERVSESAGALSDRAASYASAATEAASSYASSISDYAQSATRGVSERSGRLFTQTQSSLQSGLDYLIQEQPMMLAAIGIAAGAALGAALPETNVENRALGEARDHLARAATQAAEERLSRLKNAAGTVGDTVKDVASQHGYDSEGLKDFAHDVTEAVKEAAVGSPTSASQSAGSGQSGQTRSSSSSSAGGAPREQTSGRSPAQGGQSGAGAKTN